MLMRIALVSFVAVFFSGSRTDAQLRSLHASEMFEVLVGSSARPNASSAHWESVMKSLPELKRLDTIPILGTLGVWTFADATGDVRAQATSDASVEFIEISYSPAQPPQLRDVAFSHLLTLATTTELSSWSELTLEVKKKLVLLPVRCRAVDRLTVTLDGFHRRTTTVISCSK